MSIKYRDSRVKVYRVVAGGEIICERKTYRAAENAYCNAKAQGIACRIVEARRERTA